MSRKILEGSSIISVLSGPKSLFTGEHTHAFGTYYVIKHFPVRRRGSARLTHYDKRTVLAALSRHRKYIA